MDTNTQTVEPLPGQMAIDGEQQTLFSLEELTIKADDSIASLKAQIKEAQQVLKDVYDANEEYVQQVNRTEGEKKQLGEIKKEIHAQPDIASLLQKIKDLRGDIREKQQTVSECAVEYARLSGTRQIKKNGHTYDIVQSARLVKRK